MKKLIKKDYFNAISNYLSDNADNSDVIATIKDQEITVEMIFGFIDKEIEQLNKKNNSGSTGKMTAKQQENEKLKEAILDFMEPEKGYTVTDLIKNVPALDGMSQQKVSALVRQMKENDFTLKKEMIKRVSYFFLKDEE